jgi:hypothetical protein
MDYEIHPSARKHEVADHHIIHALEHAVVVAELDDARRLHLGPDRAANLLEIVTLTVSDDVTLVIHAMRMQQKYQSRLRGLEEPDA